MLVFIALAMAVVIFGCKKRQRSDSLLFALNNNVHWIINNKGMIELKPQRKVVNFFSNHSIIPILLMMLIFSIRAVSVGADTKNYYSYFLELQHSSMNPLIFFTTAASKEIGYDFISYIVLLVAPNFTFFLFIESIIIFVPMYFVIKRYSVRPELSYFMFIIIGNYAQSFNITRQYLCLAILLLSLQFVFEKKPIKFFLMVGLAFLFHSTALVFVIAYPLYYFKFNKKNIIIFCVLAIAMLLMFDPILKITSKVMMHDYYSKYGPSSPHMERGGLDNLILNIAFIGVFVILSIFRKKVKRNMPSASFLYDYFLKMFLCYLFIKVLAFLKGDLIERIGLYFSSALIFLIPTFVRSQEKSDRVFIYLSLLVVGILFMVYIIYVRGAYTVLPYKTIFG